MWKTEALPPMAILVRLVGVLFNYGVYRNFIAFVLFCTVVVPVFAQTPVLTQHNDNARNGQNASETVLNTSNVNVNQFGKLFAMPSDGQVYAQPLYVPRRMAPAPVRRRSIVQRQPGAAICRKSELPVHR
jgi:hypothetical protein